MKNLNFSALFVAMTVGIVSQPAFAGKNDDRWAQCLWANAPISAANWIKLPVPKRDYPLNVEKPAEYVLQFRLRAACNNALIALGKKYPPSFSADAIHAALIRTKPSELPSEEQNPKAYRCTRYFLNDIELKNPAAYDWGFGEGAAAEQLYSIQYFFAAQKGGGVGLPASGGIKKCQWIKADGTFEDA